MERILKYKLDHVVFWMATIGFHAFTRFSLIHKAGFLQFLLEIVIRNTLLAVIIYVNLLILIPKLAQQKRWGMFALFLILDFVFYVAVKNVHDMYLYSVVLQEENRDFFDNTFYNLSIATFYTAFAVALQLSREWYGQRELIRKIEIEKLNTELEYLKAQINPHFLFNSINTIYFQIDRQNTTARETLSSFSEMLRYQLYECNGKEIPIEKEVRYLQNYVDLQRYRKDDNYRITFKGSHLQGFTIAPLLLIPFVENAFKHVSHFSQGNEIRIELSRNEDTFRMEVMNTKDKPAHINGTKTGIGLKNVQRRLELLYRDRHALTIQDQPERFHITLDLNINTHEN